MEFLCGISALDFYVGYLYGILIRDLCGIFMGYLYGIYVGFLWDLSGILRRYFIGHKCDLYGIYMDLNGI